MALAIATNNAALRAAAAASGVNRDIETLWLGYLQASVLTVRPMMLLALLYLLVLQPTFVEQTRLSAMH